MTPLTCRHCGAVDAPVLGPGSGPHAARAHCRHCGRFVQWLPRVRVQRKEVMSVGSVNRCLLVGTISKYGVEVRYAPSGAPCASFTLVLVETDKDGAGST